jgi:hypothetical protein
MHGDIRVEVQAHVAASIPQQQASCDAWRVEFNHVRPHEALGMKTPAELYRPSPRRPGRVIIGGFKGGHPGPAFTIRLSDEVSSTGEALLTSSAADELALESREIGGSFFTHHLVSGLRGAADTSGDGKITLAEAYQYAFERTVSATASMTIGTQHPGYDYRLPGRGDLVLSEPLAMHCSSFVVADGALYTSAEYVSLDHARNISSVRRSTFLKV